MKISLKSYSKQQNIEHVKLSIQERLPAFLSSPCNLICNFDVKACNNYYLLNLEVSGNLNLVCQRCLDDFDYVYHNKSTVAICRSELDASELMSSYECIVSNTDDVDLTEIVTDELHLYCPEKHEERSVCKLLID